MKTTTLLFLFCLATLPVCGQLKYQSADSFPLFGKISELTETRYERLPATLRETTRPPVWDLGKNTAGLFLRFRSNSATIGLKWSLYQNRIMNHMTSTGIKGFDLYCLENGEWIFVNAARPFTDATDNETTIVTNMNSDEKEFMLYFPLYDGVTSLEIGIDSTAFIAPPNVRLPHAEKPVICYGTSILQGGCASRPGMAHTNILSRKTNREFINLGFSGNGQLDYEIAEIIAGREASVIIMDCVPNADVKQIREKMEKFYSIIRAKQPETPVLFIEDPRFPQGKYDRVLQKEVEEKNKALLDVFNSLKAKGDANIEWISSEPMIGYDNEGTVDGIHFTDLGFMRYADYLYPYIKKWLNK
jgi:lysophospholipase L1-like esterase